MMKDASIFYSNLFKYYFRNCKYNTKYLVKRMEEKRIKLQ